MNLTQGQSSVGVYFTKLKTIWEELSNYRPACSCGKCNCGGTKKLVDHYHTEYVMSFLMGLNDSFAQVRAQILMMDPIPSINEVFALISQEEHQRSISISTLGISDTMAFYVKNEEKKSNINQAQIKFQKKERHVCTYYGYTGHRVDKYYKLHGYPPGYKAKQKSGSASKPQMNRAVVNQVSDSLNKLVVMLKDSYRP